MGHFLSGLRHAPTSAGWLIITGLKRRRLTPSNGWCLATPRKTMGRSDPQRQAGVGHSHSRQEKPCNTAERGRVEFGPVDGTNGRPERGVEQRSDLYHRHRQIVITEELLDVTAGFEVLEQRPPFAADGGPSRRRKCAHRTRCTGWATKSLESASGSETAASSTTMAGCTLMYLSPPLPGPP